MIVQPDKMLTWSALNPLNATGANMHQVLMIESYGTERVNGL